MKQIQLTADDFGQNAEISAGILTLIEHGRLTATSCMTNAPEFLAQSTALKSVAMHADLGLHLNLTHGLPQSAKGRSRFPQGFPSLKKLILLLLTKQIPASLVETELKAQLNTFAKVAGKLPDFIDGHQHIHQFPVIRTVLMKVYREYFPEKTAWIRLSDSDNQSLKSIMIRLTGASQLKRSLIKENIPHPRSFSGIYPFKQAMRYRQWFQKFLNESQDQGLIMCHPGLESKDSSDPLVNSRHREFEYFMSDDFLEDCETFRVTLRKHP